MEDDGFTQRSYFVQTRHFLSAFRISDHCCFARDHDETCLCEVRQILC